MVANLQRFGFHAQPTLLVLTFDGPLDPAQVQNPGNFDLRYAGSDRLSGTRIAIDSATYDPVKDTVTLTPHSIIPLRRSYRLTVHNLGNDYAKTFGDEILAGPSSKPIVTIRSHKTVPAASGQKTTFTVWSAATRHRVFRHILHGR